ncbi:MAG: hypothetical protein IPM79_27805 [Polyangiaceae bacterium]|nr:hypothetical protein [Polyangiaceae bacterium]MBK8941309.1 hypothetical protein [Polyangiaceae bacterium]
MGKRVAFGLASTVLTAGGALLVLQLLVGYDAVRSFYPVVLFVGGLVGFLVWYFMEQRTTAGELSPGRVIRSAIISAGMGVWAIVVYLRSNDRGFDWPLLAFAAAAFAWSAGWLVWMTRRSAR